MYAMAFNGSPRRDGTTATLLKKALQGAASQGAKTELIHLSQLQMKGCQACFSCKRRGGKSDGKCALRDDMTPLYARIEKAGAVFIGSPIYFGGVSSGTRMFIERLFPYFTYRDYSSLFSPKIPVGLICTMGGGIEEEKVFRPEMQFNQLMLSLLLGPTELLVSVDTVHVKDYSELVADALEPIIGRKLEHQRTILPLDCQKAFEMGARFAGSSGG